ncbi:unnamed protein product [Rangifer tarandus platyrhynchus]|uniref:Uncharacterized protein n=1 Tax=Rangifer tarandus platyrhynchus TaxID=3082113 RepID=A0ABN8XLQ8_RANTA|nr:unnamed protein product [Rangifer tarandus platyrhynchus]
MCFSCGRLRSVVLTSAYGRKNRTPNIIFAPAYFKLTALTHWRCGNNFRLLRISAETVRVGVARTISHTRRTP